MRKANLYRGIKSTSKAATTTTTSIYSIGLKGGGMTMEKLLFKCISKHFESRVFLLKSWDKFILKYVIKRLTGKGNDHFIHEINFGTSQEIDELIDLLKVTKLSLLNKKLN